MIAYNGENILVHEFAHTMAEMAIQERGPVFAARLEAAYAQAMNQAKWCDTYAATNSSEYWAEGVQSWFDTIRESFEANGIHNHVNTSDELHAYDPGLVGLIADWLPDDDMRLRYPAGDEDEQ